MKGKLTDKKWNELAHKNARHIALLHLETGNSKKIAEAFRDIPTLKALEFLFAQAEKYRKENNMDKAAVLLEAASLIDRKTGEETEIILETSGSGKNLDTQLFVQKYTPREIFESPIE